MQNNIHPKVQAGAIAGAAMAVVIWVASLFGVDLPIAVSGALTLLFTVGAGYIKSA